MFDVMVMFELFFYFFILIVYEGTIHCSNYVYICLRLICFAVKYIVRRYNYLSNSSYSSCLLSMSLLLLVVFFLLAYNIAFVKVFRFLKIFFKSEIGGLNVLVRSLKLSLFVNPMARELFVGDGEICFLVLNNNLNYFIYHITLFII